MALTVVAPTLLAGACLLAAAFSAKGSLQFYFLTFLAAVILIGAWAVFGDHSRSFPRQGAVKGLLRGAAVGLGLLGLFTVGALVMRQIPPLAAPVNDLMSNAVVGGAALTLATTLLNGIGEELFFRNTVVARLRAVGISPRWVFILAMISYVLITTALLVPLLPLAAVVLGTVAHYEAEKTGALYSPITLHMVWSTGMFFVLLAVL